MTTAIVFSGTNILSLSLVEKLLSNGCEVYVVSKEHKKWQEQLGDVVKNHALKIFADNRYLPRDSNYIFSVNGFGYESEKDYDQGDIKNNIAWASQYALKNKSRFINILSFLISNHLQEKSFIVHQDMKHTYPQNTLTIFTGELYGRKMQMLDGGLGTKIIKEAVFSSIVTLPSINQNIYISYVEDIVSEILKSTFTFGSSDKEIVITESDSAYNFYKTLTSIKPSIASIQENIQHDRLVPLNKFIQPETKTADALSKTISWLSQYSVNTFPTKTVEIKQTQSQTEVEKKAVGKEQTKYRLPTVKKRSFVSSQKFLFVSFLLLVILVSSPFIALLLSLIGIRYSYNQFKKGNIQPVERVLIISTAMAGFSKNGLLTLSNLPLAGGFFEFSKEIAHSVELSGEIAHDALILSKDGSMLANAFFGVEDSDLVALSSSIYSKSQTMYSKMSLLNSQVESFPDEVKNMIPLEKVEEYNNYLYALTKISPQLPSLLGTDKPKTYLVLFQNNMELRPTGGFIGSFALVTLDKGRLADIDVHDVYAADGQLKGHVEPPAPIRDYLGEANWYLRDSNWDPDFVDSAKRAEWFLSKEIDREVDGVIGIDLEVAKSLLAFTGPLKLADFNQTLDDKNVYERIQYEVESEFFPGSQRKDSILTSLVRAILSEMAHLKKEDAVSLSTLVFENLKSKHIQIYIHNASAQEGVDVARWSGRMQPQRCNTTNCQTITAGIVDANVGVNKANYFIERNIDLKAYVSNGKIENTLTVEIENTASPALGLKGRYKTYIRNFVEEGSNGLQIETLDVTGRKFIEPEVFTNDNFLEMGALVEIQPNQSKKIIFKWSTPLRVDTGRPGELVFYLQKQAGTGPDFVSATLTVGREVKYNTNLGENRTFTVDW